MHNAAYSTLTKYLNYLVGVKNSSPTILLFESLIIYTFYTRIAISLKLLLSFLLHLKKSYKQPFYSHIEQQQHAEHVLL